MLPFKIMLKKQTLVLEKKYKLPDTHLSTIQTSSQDHILSVKVITKYICI